MKKIISLVGALFLGSVAMGQVNKADTSQKPATRKVLPEDLKNTTDSTGKPTGKYKPVTGADIKSGGTIKKEQVPVPPAKNDTLQKLPATNTKNKN